MDKKIEKIINDLYMLDNGLKKHEKEVIKIVGELLHSRPDAEVSERFIEELHLKLLERIGHRKGRESAKNTMPSILSFAKFAYSLAGAAVIVVVMVAAFSYFNRINNPSTPPIAVNTSPKIDKLKDNAFGSLAFNQSQFTSGPAGAGGGVGGGGGGATPEIAGKVGMPAPEIINYSYVYKGDDFGIENKSAVYKRIKELPLGNKIIDALGSLDLGLIDLGKLNSTRVGNLSLSENREFGYEVNLDFREGAISIYAGMNWPDPNAGCRDEACYERNRLRESDVPKDEELIAIADRFLNDYKIDKSSYGNPMVMKDYGGYPQPFDKNSAIYVPETIAVVYPQKINSRIVYDDAGNVSGMTVDVNIRHKKAYGARNIFSQKYESSDYEAEQDKNKIISFAENGGLYGNFKTVEPARTIDVELGTPTVEMVAIWNYDPVKRMSENMYIPSYVFPITKIPEGQFFYRKKVIVPVPKEMLEKFNQTPEAVPGLLIK